MSTRKRVRCKAVLIKRFYTLEEAAQMHQVSAEKLLELAYPLGAVYVIGKRTLINESKIRDFLEKGLGFEIVCNAEYMPYAEALKTIGIAGKEFEIIAHRAKSVYRVGTTLYVNINEFRQYMKNYQEQLKYGVE